MAIYGWLLSRVRTHLHFLPPVAQMTFLKIRGPHEQELLVNPEQIKAIEFDAASGEDGCRLTIYMSAHLTHTYLSYIWSGKAAEDAYKTISEFLGGGYDAGVNEEMVQPSPEVHRRVQKGRSGCCGKGGECD